MKTDNITFELAEEIIKMHREGYSCSAIAESFKESLEIKDRDVVYSTGYRVVREAYQVLKFKDPSSNID